MHRWYSLDKQTRINALNQVAEATGMPPYAVEKDWWVVQTLAIIFEMKTGSHLVFKGGTSLSKAWEVIERFSEDIDLAVDRSFLGSEGELSKKQKTRLRKQASKYISEEFYPELQEKFKEKGLDGVTFNIIETGISDQDPRIIEIFYPNVIDSPAYLKPRIQIEIGFRYLKEPYTVMPVRSLVDEHFSETDFAQKPVDIQVVNPERTLLEKIFLLHEEFQRPAEKRRINRLSRHLYDICQLSKTEYAEKALNDKELYQTIVKHRQEFTKVGGVDYNLHQPQTINPIPPADLTDAWKADYKTMQEHMIYGDSPNYDELIECVKEFVEKLKQVEWTMDIQFPPPVTENKK